MLNFLKGPKTDGLIKRSFSSMCDHLFKLEPEATHKRSVLSNMTMFLICLQSCGEVSYLLSASSCSVPNDKNPVQHGPDTWSPTHRHTLGQAARCCPDKVLRGGLHGQKKRQQRREKKESVKESERCMLSHTGEDNRGVNVKRRENRKHKKVILEMCEGMKEGKERQRRGSGAQVTWDMVDGWMDVAMDCLSEVKLATVHHTTAPEDEDDEDTEEGHEDCRKDRKD